MRKVLYCILIFMSIIMIGCQVQQDEPEMTEEPNTFEIKSAMNVANNYMKYLSSENYESASTLYTKDLLSKTKPMDGTDIKIKGYKIDETNEIGRSGLFKIKLTRSNAKQPMCALDEYTLKVVKDGAEYKISEVKCVSDKEGFLEDGGIRLRDKNNVNTNLIINFSGVPKYGYSKDDVAHAFLKYVPRERFGTINFGYAGDKLAFTTYGEGTYMGIVNIDETLITQGPSGDKGAGESGDQKGKEAGPREKPIGKEVTSLDLLENSTVELLIFSLDEKFIVAQYDKEGVGKCIRVYKTESGELIPVNFEREFPVDKVDITFTSFDKDVLNFEVIPNKNIGQSEAGLIGKWQLNLKEFKVNKL